MLYKFDGKQPQVGKGSYVSDLAHVIRRPKLEDYPNHLYLVVHEIEYKGNSIHCHELDLFLGKNFLISVRKKEMPVVSKVKERVQKEADFFKKGPDFLLYMILDEMVQSYKKER